MNFALVVIVSCCAAEAILDTAESEPERFGCGPTTLSIAARLLERPVSTDDMRQALGDAMREPCSLDDLRRAAERLGFATAAVRLSPKDVGAIALPLIICIKPPGGAKTDTGHFIVVYGRIGEDPQGIDYPDTPGIVAQQTLTDQWDGLGLYVGRNPEQLSGTPLASARAASWVIGLIALTAVAAIALLVRVEFRQRVLAREA